MKTNSSLRMSPTEVLKSEIEKLAQCIEKAKSEVGALANQKGDAEKVSGDSTLHLDEVIRATEAASTTIMDAADVIQANAGGMGGEKEQAIMDATARIFEACTFQDVTGQRLTKVISVINEVDERLHKIIALFGAMPEHSAKPADGSFDEKDLLNGPQLPANATSQADIDALFSDFKP